MWAKNWRIILEGAFALVFVIIAFVAFFSWLGSRDAVVKAQAQSDANKQAQQQINEQQKVLVEQINGIADVVKQMKAEHEADLKNLSDKFAKTNTPQDVAALVSQLMKLQQPITFVTPPATTANPNPTPVAQISAIDTPQVKAYVQECETCKLNLDAKTKELTYSQQQQEKLNDSLKLKDLTIDNKDKEIVTWKQAAQGGTTWQRFQRRMKYFGVDALIVGGITAGAICGTGHCK